MNVSQLSSIGTDAVGAKRGRRGELAPQDVGTSRAKDPHRRREQLVPRELRDVVFVDGVRTPFGKANSAYADTRADDLVIKCIAELMRRHPELPPERVDEVAIAATTQIGDQGLTIGRTAALLSGLPRTTPGYAIDRMCAGAMTAVTTTAAGIAFGAYDVVVAGGVEHMGHHPMGEGVDPNPRILAEKLVDPSALVMGQTAENLHDRYPDVTQGARRRVRASPRSSGPRRPTTPGKIQPQPGRAWRPGRPSSAGVWSAATSRRGPGRRRPSWPRSKTPFRPHGRVTAGNSAGLNDGATACLLAAEETAVELGLPVRMRLVSYAFAGVDPEVMGVGPIPATEKALAQGRSDDRRHRAVRDQRGVRRAGAGVPRPLRHRRRRPAGQPRTAARSPSAIRWRHRASG